MFSTEHVELSNDVELGRIWKYAKTLERNIELPFNILPVHGLLTLTSRFELVAVNPFLQEQLCPPIVLMQVEFGPHIDGVDRHSSTSTMKDFPFLEF